MSSTTTTTSTPTLTARSALQRVLATDGRISALVLRLGLGLVMLPHGAQKVFGWFGGYGFAATLDFFTTGMGLPWLVALAVIAAESLGALALVLGLGGRVAAVGILAVMLGAIFSGHLEHGFFMNWSGSQGGEGIEYHLLVIALAVGVLLEGSGRASLDRLLARRLR